jgi:hypothetical protein
VPRVAHTDVRRGKEYYAVWVIDGLLLYPAIRWLERIPMGETDTAVGMGEDADEDVDVDPLDPGEFSPDDD